MKRSSVLFTFSLLLFTSSAAVPLRWTVETSRATPAQFEAYQGETLDLEATLQSQGKPLELSGIAALYWQTNGMGSTYWEASAAVNSNRMSAVWTPEMDVGAKVYNCFIGQPGTIYHAAFQLRLRPSPGATPNVLPLPTPVIDFAKVRVLNPPWEGGGGGGVNTNAVIDIIHATVAGAARPLPKYLHALDFYDSYPEAAAEYYEYRRTAAALSGSCSAVRSGNFLYRNFDYPFDDRAEFIVRMSSGVQPPTTNHQSPTHRFASVGVANVGTNLTESFVTSGKHSLWYKALPGATVDGINENGVVAEINVVDGDPQTSGWHTTGDIHPLAAVRWALDHATNAQHAAEYLASNVRFPEGWQQNFHYMIADETSTYIVENGEAYPVPSALSPTGADQPVLTNFRLYPTHSTGEGQERYAALMSGANITSQWWTLTYTPDGYRASDLPGITGDALTQLFEYWASKPREAHRGETFPSSLIPHPSSLTWWQSVHTSVYDITNRVLRIAVQETDDWYTFALAKNGTDEAKVRAIASEVVAPVAARKGSDITTGEGEIGIGSIETDPDISIADNIEILDHANGSQNTRISELSTSLQRKANKDEVLSLDGGTITGDLEVTGDFEAGGEASFGGNVTVGANRFYVGGSPFEEILTRYTLNRVFKDHADDTGIHVTAAEKTSWNAKLSSSDVIDPASATTTGKAADALNVKQALDGKLDLGGGTITNSLTIHKSLHVGEPFATTGMNGNWSALFGNYCIGNNSSCAFAFGFYTYPTNEYSFVFNGSDPENNIWPEYGTHGNGTINLNPVGGLSGFWIGETNLEMHIANLAPHYTPSASDPTFSNAVLSVGIDTNVLAAVAASTNAVAQIGEFYSAFSDIGLTPTQGGMTLAGLLAALVAAVTWLKKTLGKVADNSGKPTDDFATDLLEKQVAKDAIDERTPYALVTGDLKDRSIKLYDATSEGVTVTLPTLSTLPVGVTDFEAWIDMGATVKTVIYAPDTIEWKDGKVPTTSDYTASATNIVHFTIVKTATATKVTACLAGFKAATPAA